MLSEILSVTVTDNGNVSTSVWSETQTQRQPDRYTHIHKKGSIHKDNNV